MALEVNASSKEVVAVGTLYTGLCDMKIVAINPTLEEIKALGLPAQKEPEYTTTEEVKDALGAPTGETYAKTRVDVYLKRESVAGGKPIQAKVAFWIEDRPRLSQKGDKAQYINAFGDTTWAVIGQTPLEQESTKNWYRGDGMRQAFSGEEYLIEFMKAWANVGRENKCSIDNISAIAKGDVSELKRYVPALAKNEVRFLLGVKDNQYQAVYDRRFGRTYEKGNTAWIKATENQYSQFKADYQNSFELKVFTGAPSTPDTPHENGAESKPGGLVF